MKKIIIASIFVFVFGYGPSVFAVCEDFAYHYGFDQEFICGMNLEERATFVEKLCSQHNEEHKELCTLRPTTVTISWGNYRPYPKRPPSRDLARAEADEWRDCVENLVSKVFDIYRMSDLVVEKVTDFFRDIGTYNFVARRKDDGSKIYGTIAAYVKKNDDQWSCRLSRPAYASSSTALFEIKSYYHPNSAQPNKDFRIEGKMFKRGDENSLR